MNNTRKYRILIIEPSQIVRIGLSSLIEQCRNYSLYSSISDLTYYNTLSNKVFDLILINPTVIDYNRRKDIKAIFSASNRGLIFAISYFPFEDSIMLQYDGYINILDSKEQINKN